MLILVSPAKTLDYESNINFDDFSVASHLSDSEILIKDCLLYTSDAADE